MMSRCRLAALALHALLVGACGHDPAAPPSTGMLGRWHYADLVQFSDGGAVTFTSSWPGSHCSVATAHRIAAFDSLVTWVER